MPALGLFGGTFDPIHIGHLCMAEWALNQLALERVVFIPAGQPPHKTQRHITENKHRLEMLKCAVSEYPDFETSTYELDKTEPSYTLNTLKYFHKTYPQATRYFLIGQDSLLSLHTWYRFEEFLNYCDFAVFPRQADSISRIQLSNQTDVDRYLTQHLPSFLGHVHWLNMPLMTISSTQIRQLIQQQHSVRTFLPPTVWPYIQKHGLYYNGDS